MAVLLVDFQRNALYRFVLFEMEDFGDMRISLKNGNLDSARQMREYFELDMALLDQIGWERTRPRQVYALTMYSNELKSLFTRLMAQAKSYVDETAADIPNEQELKDAHTVIETGEMVLAALPEWANRG